MEWTIVQAKIARARAPQLLKSVSFEGHMVGVATMSLSLNKD